MNNELTEQDLRILKSVKKGASIGDGYLEEGFIHSSELILRPQLEAFSAFAETEEGKEYLESIPVDATSLDDIPKPPYKAPEPDFNKGEEPYDPELHERINHLVAKGYISRDPDHEDRLIYIKGL